MKLTTKSEYALLALIYIARQKNRDFVKIEEICGKYGISKKYLEKLFKILRLNKIVKTKRGILGGYQFARHPSQISSAEIIRLMDGALAPTDSVSKYFFSSTPLKNEKKISLIMKDIRNYIALKLERVKITDLI